MLIKLTNASKGFEGQVIAVNKSIVLSVFEKISSEEGKPPKTETFVYAGESTTWQVQESADEVIKLFNQ